MRTFLEQCKDLYNLWGGEAVLSWLRYGEKPLLNNVVGGNMANQVYIFSYVYISRNIFLLYVTSNISKLFVGGLLQFLLT